MLLTAKFVIFVFCDFASKVVALDR